MVTYTATKSVVLYNTIEEAVTGLETYLHTLTTGSTYNLKCGITRTGSNRYAAWVVWTSAA